MAPWDLQNQPFSWVLQAEAAQDAENNAREKAEKAAEKNARR